MAAATAPRRLKLERQIAELHGRLAFLLRDRYGKRNPHLHGFGLEPTVSAACRWKRVDFRGL